jgi:hypothetical protein
MRVAAVATREAPEQMQVKTRCIWRVKSSSSKSFKTGAGKKRSRDEAAGSTQG